MRLADMVSPSVCAANGFGSACSQRSAFAVSAESGADPNKPPTLGHEMGIVESPCFAPPLKSSLFRRRRRPATRSLHPGEGGARGALAVVDRRAPAQRGVRRLEFGDDHPEWFDVLVVDRV